MTPALLRAAFALSLATAACTAPPTLEPSGKTARDEADSTSSDRDDDDASDARGDEETTAPPAAATPKATPAATGCITDVSTGLHRFACDGLTYHVSVPGACAAGGCGLVVDLHGATMNAAIEDANTGMRALGDKRGYVVVQPDATASPMFLGMPTWNPDADDAKIVATTKVLQQAFAIDAKKVHLMGFSAGGALGFRVLCKNPDAFASYALAAGSGCSSPTKKVPVLYMQGRRDMLESFTSKAVPQRDVLVNAWKLGAGTKIAGDGRFARTRFGDALEFLEHDYASPSPILGGHCYPGSTNFGAEHGELLPFFCAGSAGFAWGEAAMAFFVAHPRP